MKYNNSFKIYRNNKLDIKDAVAREIRFRASLIGEVALELGKCVIDDFAVK